MIHRLSSPDQVTGSCCTLPTALSDPAVASLLHVHVESRTAVNPVHRDIDTSASIVALPSSLRPIDHLASSFRSCCFVPVILCSIGPPRLWDPPRQARPRFRCPVRHCGPRIGCLYLVRQTSHGAETGGNPCCKQETTDVLRSTSAFRGWIACSCIFSCGLRTDFRPGISGSFCDQCGMLLGNGCRQECRQKGQQCQASRLRFF